MNIDYLFSKLNIKNNIWISFKLTKDNKRAILKSTKDFNFAGGTPLLKNSELPLKIN